RVGNTSLYRDSTGKIHLFFVSVGYFGWSCSSLNHMYSTDGGKTWSSPERIVNSPFFNISTLPRSPAIGLQGGGFLLPVYHEIIRKLPELLTFDEHGKIQKRQRMSFLQGSLQPCLVVESNQVAHAYLRNRYAKPPKLYYQSTRDGGRTWSTTSHLSLENRDAPVASCYLPSLGFLLAYNPDKERAELCLAFSRDGQQWRKMVTLEKGNNDSQPGLQEYSYPTMLVSGDTVDLLYTYRREGFKHLRFTAAWIRERECD
ncbi:MAG TPA: exo-alpha-sialidase, partial [Gemmatales bacterium]|nr:exo-alpha-sialidase [Gemmatales bacterium]